MNRKKEKNTKKPFFDPNFDQRIKRRQNTGVIKENDYEYIAEFNNELYFISPDEPQLKEKFDILDDICKGMVWGQLKLLINPILFFLMFWDQEEYPNPTVIYAGAAPGKNVGILNKLFPEITFHLYDPRNVFTVKKNEKIFIHVEYFTDQIARKWAGKGVFFWSDIRREIAGESFEEKVHSELMVIGDQEMQLKWHKIIKPRRSMLKFRMPNNHYLTDLKNYDYLYGYVMDQPAKPAKSRETRLIPVGDESVVWDITKYMERLDYRNSLVRSETKFYNIFDGSEDDNDEGKYDNSFDTTFFLSVLKDYLYFIRKVDDKKNTIELADEIVAILINK